MIVYFGFCLAWDSSPFRLSAGQWVWNVFCKYQTVEFQVYFFEKNLFDLLKMFFFTLYHGVKHLNKTTKTTMWGYVSNPMFEANQRCCLNSIFQDLEKSWYGKDIKPQRCPNKLPISSTFYWILVRLSPHCWFFVYFFFTGLKCKVWLFDFLLTGEDDLIWFSCI